MHERQWWDTINGYDLLLELINMVHQCWKGQKGGQSSFNMNTLEHQSTTKRSIVEKTQSIIKPESNFKTSQENEIVGSCIQYCFPCCFPFETQTHGYSLKRFMANSQKANTYQFSDSDGFFSISWFALCINLNKISLPLFLTGWINLFFVR